MRVKNEGTKVIKIYDVKGVELSAKDMINKDIKKMENDGYGIISREPMHEVITIVKGIKITYRKEE